MTNNKTRKCSVCGVIVATINPDRPFSSITLLDNCAPVFRSYRCLDHPEVPPAQPEHVVLPSKRKLAQIHDEAVRDGGV